MECRRNWSVRASIAIVNQLHELFRVMIYRIKPGQAFDRTRIQGP